ncbi:hypothetical protein EDB84DRAFT_1435213 [Lactarius hengduanensis]|nr:hypothetical protein EDB84DRAFT_1435213 [Lactarius hengduanensis]
MWCGSAVVAWCGTLRATWRRDGGLAVAGPYASCRDGGALHAVLRRRRGLACRGGGLAVAGSCVRRDGGAVVAGSCKPRWGGVLGRGRAEVARVHEGAATACNGSEACLPHSPRHPNTTRDPATTDPPPRLPNIARKTPPPLTCPHHGTQDPDRQPTTFLQHGTQDPADSSRRLNTALKAPQPPTSTSPQHGTQDMPPQAQDSPDLPQLLPRRAAVAHDRNHDGHEHAAGNELGFCPVHQDEATLPPLPRIFATRKSTTTTPPHESPATQKPHPTPCGRNMQDLPPPATSLRHGPATVNPPPPRPPMPRHPDKARQTTPTHHHADSSPRRLTATPSPQHCPQDHHRSHATPMWTTAPPTRILLDIWREDPVFPDGGGTRGGMDSYLRPDIKLLLVLERSGRAGGDGASDGRWKPGQGFTVDVSEGVLVLSTQGSLYKLFLYEGRRGREGSSGRWDAEGSRRRAEMREARGTMVLVVVLVIRGRISIPLTKLREVVVVVRHWEHPGSGLIGEARQGMWKPGVVENSERGTGLL